VDRRPRRKRSRGCATQGAFTIPLAASGERVALGTRTLALRATSHQDALAFVAGGVPQSGDRRAAGTTASVDLVNALGEPTTVHWHGLSVDTRNDGNGEAPVAPARPIATRSDPQSQRALLVPPAPAWRTARQVNRGLFGTFEVEDDDELALRRALRVVVGETQLTLVLTDRRTGDGDRYAPAPEDELLGWYGCVPHVNGILRPYHDVARTAYRLRILNASNARTYRLAFRDDAGNAMPFHLAGTDGGLLEQAVRCHEVLLSPAERADLVVDFAGLAQGRYVTFETRAFAPCRTCRERRSTPCTHMRLSRARFPTARRSTSCSSGSAARVGRAGRCRQTAVALPAIVDGDEDRPLRLGFAKGRWRINDRVYDMDTTPSTWPAAQRRRGSCATTTRAHRTRCTCTVPVSRGRARDESRAGRSMAVDDRGACHGPRLKDTVLVWPGESVRIAIDFRTPYPDAQVYLVHCHNLEHEDAGMMLRVRVG
jgi:suppressor of ftsI/bilirubin oxidase